MRSFFTRKPFLSIIGLALLGNLIIFAFVHRFSSILPFNSSSYFQDAHHYIQDERIFGKTLSMVNALAQYDSQWYLRIADEGYPTNPIFTDLADHHHMDGLKYGFYPLYPTALASIDVFFRNVELSAFFLSNFLLIINSVSLYWVISKLLNKNLALKSVLLVLLFPFGIFLRSYYAEGLFLFLLIWIGYFLAVNKFLLSAMLLGLLSVTKGNGVLINLYFLALVAKQFYKKKLNLLKALIILILISIPILSWMIYQYFQTGDPLYSHHILKQWYSRGFSVLTPLYNIFLISVITKLPFHTHHFSQLDILVALSVLFILIKSYKALPRSLWWISFLLWGTPLLVRDFAGFSRYQSVNYPLFIFLAQSLSKTSYKIVCVVMGLCLLVVSLFFINWYWIG